MILYLIAIILLLVWYKSSFTFQPVTKPYYGNIERLTINNPHYRQVLTTTSNLQLVLMSLLPGEEIGQETHSITSQFIRVEKGEARAIINQQVYLLTDGDVIVIPPGAVHNIINTSSHQSLKLYTIYIPPEHPPQTLQHIKPTESHH